MRLNLSIILTASAFALFSGGNASAAVSQQAIDSVLAECPIEVAIGKCSNGVVDFVEAIQPGTSADMLKLVRALADAAAHPQITLPMCKEIERAIRLAATAVPQPAPHNEILGIADQLCVGTDLLQTGSTGGPGDDDDEPYTPPTSLGDPADTPEIRRRLLVQ